MSGSILETFSKNYEKLCTEYKQYKDFHDTMSQVIPNILELLDSLFLEEHVKAAPNYELLVEDYLNAIKALIAPENYKQIRLESQLPDIYDAPSTRRDKIKRINKLVRPKIVPKTVIDNASASASTSDSTSPVPQVIDPYAARRRRQAPVKLQKKGGGSYPKTNGDSDTIGSASSASGTEPVSHDPLPIKVGFDLNEYHRQKDEQQRTELTEITKAAKKVYQTPLEALREQELDQRPPHLGGTTNISSSGVNNPLNSENPLNGGGSTSLPDRIYISLPDDTESKAILESDGRIIDMRNGLERGRILPTGKIILDKKEFGCIPVVERDNTKDYIPVSHTFGRFRETRVSYATTTTASIAAS